MGRSAGLAGTLNVLVKLPPVRTLLNLQAISMVPTTPTPGIRGRARASVAEVYAGRIRALREALGLSQDQVAQRAGFGRVNANRAESGTNKISSVAMRDGLARAFGLSRADFDAYLAGTL